MNIKNRDWQALSKTDRFKLLEMAAQMNWYGRGKRYKVYEK